MWLTSQLEACPVYGLKSQELRPSLGRSTRTHCALPQALGSSLADTLEIETTSPPPAILLLMETEAQLDLLLGSVTFSNPFFLYFFNLFNAYHEREIEMNRTYFLSSTALS